MRNRGPTKKKKRTLKEKIELGRMAFEAKQNNFVTWKEINEYHHVGYHMIQSCIKLYKENLEEKKWKQMKE